MAGWAYIRGASPDTINFEHPPLAKYLIGLSELAFMNHAALGLVASVLTLILLYWISRNILDTPVMGLVAPMLLSLDKMYIDLSTISMLDIYATLFATLSVCLLTGRRRLNTPMLGITIGLALSCKWTTAFLVLLPLAYWAFNRKRQALESYLVLLLVATATYVVTYSVFFASGHSLYDFISLQKRMIEFHWFRRLRGGPKPLWILMNFLTGVEGPTRIQTLLIDSVSKTVNVVGTAQGLSLIQWYNPLTWPTSFSSSLLLLCHSIRKDRRLMPMPLGFILLLASMSTGKPFIWYVLPGLPLGLFSLTYIISKAHAESKDKRAASFLLAAYLVSVALWSVFVHIPHYVVTMNDV